MKPVKNKTNEGKIRSALEGMTEMLSEPIKKWDYKRMLYLYVREEPDEERRNIITLTAQRDSGNEIYFKVGAFREGTDRHY